MPRFITLKPNDKICKCPKCGNNTKFTVHSERCAEDCCEVWAICECGYDATEFEWGSRMEDVWGSTDDANCQMAIQYTWNELLEKENDRAI